MQPHELISREELCAVHNAAFIMIGALEKLTDYERSALALVLLSAVDQQDHPKDRHKLEIVRDALCQILQVTYPGLVEFVPEDA
jgi:hypothetical protein